MAPANQIAKTKSSRRRKKRRTEDFSSDSDSDSDSDSNVKPSTTNDNDNDNDNNNSMIIDSSITTTRNNQPDINVHDIDIDSDSDSDKKSANKPEPLTPNIHRQLNNVKLTTNQLTENNHSINSIPKGIDTSAISKQVNQDRIELNNQYLKLMTQDFNQNLDELRKKPDFNDKSLIILAKALQSGGNLFDKSIIDELLHNSS